MTDERLFELVEDYLAREREENQPNPSGIMFRIITNEEYLLSILADNPKNDSAYQILRDKEEMVFNIDTGTRLDLHTGYTLTIPATNKLIIGEKTIE